MEFQRSELEMFCLSTPSKFLKWQRRGISSVTDNDIMDLCICLFFFFLSALRLRCADWILASKMCFSMLRLRNQNTIFANILMLHLRGPVLSACLPSLPYKTQCKSDLLEYIEYPHEISSIQWVVVWIETWEQNLDLPNLPWLPTWVSSPTSDFLWN